MKKLIATFAVVLGWASAVLAAAPATLTTLRAIQALTNAEASQGLPVAFEGTVTYYDKNGINLFVQEGNLAIYVQTAPGANLAPGDGVLVRGKTHSDFRPDVISSDVTLIHHGALPKPIPADFEQLIRAERDCMRVRVRAKVRSANI